MADFEDTYRRAYENLGRPLTSEDAMPEEFIANAESNLQIHLPKSLRAYYLVAGQEKEFNCFHNRLLPPEEWFIDSDRFVFFEENQQVVFWELQPLTGRLMIRL